MFDHGYALLIGVDESKRPTLALPVVAKDIAALASVFTDTERCGYRKDHVKLVTGRNATRAGIVDGLAWLQQKLETDPGDEQTAIVYFSGHGHREPGGETMLLPYDATIPFRFGGLKAKELADQIDILRPRRLLVVLDCCHAGAIGVKGTSPELASVAVTPSTAELSALAAGEGRAVLSSSTDTQQSFIRADGQMSVFTYHMVEALLGHATPPGTPTVTVTQIMEHVGQRVPVTTLEMHGAKQVPTFHYDGTAFPIALVLGGKGISKAVPAPDPLSMVLRSNLQVDVLKGSAVNVEIGNSPVSSVEATVKVGIVEKGGTLTNVKIGSLGGDS